MKKTTATRSYLPFIIAILLTVAVGFSSASQTGLPKIGILTQIGDPDHDFLFNDPAHLFTWIDGSTIDFIQIGGILPVALKVGTDLDDLEALLDDIDGLVLPAGSPNNEGSPIYLRYLDFITDYAINRNSRYQAVPDQFSPLPVLAFGTSFAPFVSRVASLSSVPDLDPQCSAETFQAYLPVNIDEGAISSSKIFKRLQYKWMSGCLNNDGIRFNHRCAITTESFNDHGGYKAFELIGEVTIDGINYAGIVEHKSYPFLALQFDPSKSVFARTPETAAIIRGNCPRFVTDLSIFWLDRSLLKPQDIDLMPPEIRRQATVTEDAFIMASHFTERILAYKSYGLSTD